MSPRNLALPTTIRPCSSMTALATALGLSLHLTEFWRVEVVNTVTGERAAIGDFEDKDDALEACWAMNSPLHDDDEDWPEALADKPDVKTEVVGPYQVLTAILGRKDGVA